MRLHWLAAALVLFVGTAGLPVETGAQAAPQKSAAAKDWTRMVVRTLDGGFRMGNPAASVKLVEYGSLTCPHCAHFSADAMPGLKARIRSGNLSYEYRNFVLNSADIAATLLARCGGTKNFFAITEAMFALQPKWVGAAAAMTDEQKREMAALPIEQRLGRIADAAGLRAIVAKRGVTLAQARQCLSSKAAMDELERIYRRGSDLGVQGTPTFFVNGERARASTWADLEPILLTAGSAG